MKNKHLTKRVKRQLLLTVLHNEQFCPHISRTTICKRVCEHFGISMFDLEFDLYSRTYSFTRYLQNQSNRVFFYYATADNFAKENGYDIPTICKEEGWYVNG